eukprot:3632634-Amphidinium_carterae.1
MRPSLTQAIPSNIAAKLDAYGQYAVPDILFLLMKEIFPNEEDFRLMMSEEVNRVPFDKSMISFAKKL